MRSIIVSYTLENAKPHQKLVIQRALYGYDDFSNNCSYRYKRKGLIEACHGKKLNRGVFIMSMKFKNKIIPLLKKNKAKFQIIPINLP